jgi:Fungal specific transcription factor domain
MVSTTLNFFLILPLSVRDSLLTNTATTIIWPMFGKSKDGQNVFVKHWMWTIMESPVAFYAQILSAAVHLQGNSRSDAIQRWSAVTSLIYKVKAIEALKEDVQRASVAPDAEISDGVIAAVLNLAVHDCMNNAVLEELHPRSPLSTHRNIDIYGRMEIREEHMKALYALVNRRGGLQAIDRATFATVIPP